MFNKEKLQRFSIRKLTVGAASVLIGVSLMTEMNNNKVYADVRTTNENSNSQVHDNSDGNTLNLSTDLKSKADEAGTADSEVTNNSNAKVGGDGVTDNSNARNVEIKNIDDSKKDQQSGDAVAPREKTANTIQKHEENVAKGTTVDSNDLQVTKASSVVSPQIKQIQAKYQTSKNPPLEKQINPTDRNSDGKVVVKAEDPSNYPSEWNNLIDKDRYIYQVLSLNNDPDNDPDTKLILSVNRNDSTDTNIYAYVIANNKKIKTATVGVNQKEIIKINKRGYQINNDGSSNIIIGGNKESTQNSSTVTSAPGYYTSEGGYYTSEGGYYDSWDIYHPKYNIYHPKYNIYHTYSNVNPIKQSYGLGSTTSNDFSAIGEIIPIYTESSVIKYYYYDDNGDLQEFKDSDLSLHPNVVVTGLTGQEFKIPNVDQYKQVIRGFYLTSKDKDIPTNFTGTLSQFEEGKYYKKAYYNYDTDNVEYYSVYHQISPDGTMEVGVFDKNGNQITAYDENGHKRPKLVEIEAGHHFTFEFQIQDQTHFLTVRNPYVTAAPHEVQFIYKKLGSIIPVDEHGKQIGNKIQFENNLNDPTKALPGIVPSISGYTPLYKLVGAKKVPTRVNDQVDPKDHPGENIEVIYRANAQTATITYIDDTTNTKLDSKDASGKFGQAITFATAPADEIDSYKKQGYVLVSSTFDNNKYQADNSNNVFYVHLKHKTESVTRNGTVTRTIHYLYDNGNTAQPDKTQTVSFNETGTKDYVTGKTTWDNDNAQTVDSVSTPSIIGYTPDKPSIEKQAFKFGDKDVEVTVKYNANAQTAKITYIDDTTKNNLDSKDATGKFGQAITFKTAPADEIAKYEKQGYKLVSNDFNSNKYQADNNKNVFHVHFVHDTKKVSRNDDVNMTVHYVMDDNSEAPSDNKQTVSFTENGIQDLVTQKITWTPANSQTLNNVTSPVLTGYTADIEIANGKAVNFGDPDINVTVTYHANAQTAKITYIDDDTTGKTLSSDNGSGKFGQAITFEHDPAEVIKGLEEKGYVLVSNTFNNQKYDSDNTKNQFEVHLKHKTESVTRNDTVTRTIHYLYDDGNTAKPDKIQTVSFNETGTKDDVTGETTWDNDNAQAVDRVITPSITGYTPDKPSIEKQAFKFGDKDVEVTVTYNANAQTAKITYIDDDTTGKTLSSDNGSGKFGQAITFEHDPAEVIKGLEEKGYVLVSNTFNNQKYDSDNTENQFEVHLKHGTKNVSRDHNVNMTVHYVMDDGSKAPSDSKQTVSFTESGIQDLVTQKITWTPADSQKFDDVVTPAITGYTPDQDKVAGQTANFDTQDRKVTVTYSPDIQLGRINYIDDNTGKTLTRDDFSGKTNEHENYTPIDRIQEFENKGYVFVSSDYPDGGFNFDDNDQQDQVFNVHLKHGIVTVTTKKPQTPNMPINPDSQSPKYPKDISNTNSDVKRTIDYKFKDGKTAQPTVNDSLHFERTVVIDKVTGDVLSDTWTPSQDFNDVQTPVIQGYTPDRTVVSDRNIGHDHQNIVEHVVYNPDAQHMTITYVDDTTGKELHTDKLDGVSDQDTKYTTDGSIKQYEGQHYKLVSDSTKGQDLIFDHDDNVDQTYEVHFVHGTHTINQTTSPKQTVHYVYADGLVRQGKAADDNVQQLSFKRDGYNDEVTGVDHWNAWTPANSNYKAVASPVIQGYTPDKSVIEKSTVNPTDKDTEITVVYSPDAQHMAIKYIDDTTGKTLHTDNPNGVSDQDAKYTTSDTIKKYEDQHYKLVSDSTKGQDLIFDHDDNVDQTYEVHFVHGTQKVNRQDTVTSTIDYKFEDGKTAQPTVTQTKHFSEDGVKDLVTGKITWDEAEPQKFDDIATKSIVGYTPDTDNVAGSTVNFGDKDIEVTVTYHNNAQTAKITYIDDTTKTNLDSKDANGKFNQVITFATAPTDEIANYEKQGYVLVSNSFNNQTYAADNKKNVFYVHLKHGIVPVTPDTDHNDVPKNTVKEAQPDQLTKEVDLTVQYVNSDDAKFTGELPANQNQKVTFTGTAYVDKVTGQLVNAKKQEDGTWVVDDSKTDKPQVIWKADGKDSFDAVISPVENGYHLTDIDSHRKGNNVEEITGLTQDSGSIIVTVTYTKNGKISPVDKDDNPITGADQPVFPTDPTDPTKVDSGNIPDLSDKGYHPLDKNVKPGDPVDPDLEDPSKDITVKYVKSGTISVKYHDNTEDKDIDGYGKNASGDEDDPFSYDPTNDLKTLTDQGYVLDGDMPEIPAKFTDGAQEVIINLKHGTTTVTSNNPGHPGEPVDPKNSEGPKYPNGTELDQVKRTGTQTIHYVGAGDKTPADNKQTFIFTREITFDNVTGKIINVTPWNVENHTFGKVDTPVIPGYHADKDVAGGETVTPDDLNKVITVTYAPDGNPGNPSDHGDTPSPEPTPEPEPTPTPNPTPDDQPDSETSSDEHFENVKPKDKLDKNNPKKVDAYKKQRKIIKTKIAKQGHTEIAEPIEDKVTRENNVKVVSDPVENKAAEPKLPQTSEADNSIIGLLGMLLASFAAMFGFDSLHSHDKKHKN